MIILTKAISLFFAIIVISKTYLDYKKKRESLTMLFFWTITWIGIVYVAINPEVLIRFSQKVGEPNTGIGTFLGLAFIFLFFITYRVYVKANRLEQKIKDIVIKIGIKDIDEE